MTTDELLQLKRENRLTALSVAQDKCILASVGIYTSPPYGYVNVSELISDAKEIEKYLNEE